MISENYIQELTDNGIGLDVDGYKNTALKYLAVERNTALNELSERMDFKISLDDPASIVRRFQERGITLELMTQEYLKKRQDDCRDIYLLYRAKDYSQKLHTYGLDKLAEHMDNAGRIHATWYIAKATTGRLICKAPALQGMPSYCRQFFKPADGCCFVTIDYSTIEMRVLAFLAKDTKLLSELQKGCDIHRLTASAIFKKPPDEINEEERKVGKTVGFMITYGGSAIGLSKKLSSMGIDCTVTEAQKMINAFNLSHISVAYYHYDLKHGIIKPTTIMGRVFEGLSGSKALNYPVQASAAEGFKLTLAEVMRRKPPAYKLVMAIHDSITLEVPVAEKEAAESFLKSTAETVMGNFLSPVPVFVEVKNNI